MRTSSISPKQFFLIVFCITLLFKLYVSSEIPITGDEALFYAWSQDLSLGYYDHPPMIGWILAALASIGHSLTLIRLPASLLNHLIAFGIIDLVIRWSPQQRSNAFYIASIYLLLPASLLSVLVTNDSALVLFTALSSYAFLRAELQYRENPNAANGKVIPLYLASGIFIGLAFLSKYLVVFLAVSYALILLWKKRFIPLLCLILAAIPFGLLNYYWNIENCWQNILFNAVNRTDDLVSPWVGLPAYLATLIYLLTPWLLIYFWKQRSQCKSIPVIMLLALIPLALFGVLSLKQIIGAHWIPAYMPVLMLAFALTLSEAQLIRSRRWTIYLAAVHAAFLLFVILAPASTWQGFKFYERLSTLKNSTTIAKLAIEDMDKEDTLMTMGYSASSSFAYYLERRVPVFGMGTKFGRHDDLNFDFKSVAGKNIRIFNSSPLNIDDFAPYFDKVSQHQITLMGINYWYIDGKGFKYETYRKLVLQPIADKFYRFPGYLPKSNCSFKSKYELN